MLKKLFSHTAIYGLAPQISKIASFLALPFLTKELTSNDYGVYGLLTAYTTSISVLSVLGLRLVLVNSFYHSPGQYKWTWRQLYGFLNLWNVVYAVILGVLVLIVIPPEAVSNKWLIMFLNIIPLVFFGQTSTIGLTYYQLNQMPLKIASRSLFFGILTVVLNIVLIVHFKMGYMGWFWSNFIVGILNNISYWYPLNIKFKIKPIYNFKWRLVKKSLKVSLPVIPHHYSSYLLDSSDKVVMDFEKISTSDIGKYNVAYSVGNMFNALGVAGGYAIGPLMNEKYKKKDDYGARNLVFVMQIVFFYLTFIGSIWMKEVFQIMIKNASLSQLYPLAIIIVMSYNYRPMYLGAVNKLFYEEKTNFLWKLTLTAAIINVSLNLILMPFYGYKVAAFTTFAAFLYMGYAGYYYKAFKEINKANYHQFIWLVVTLILAVCAYEIVEYNVFVKIAISIGYSVLAFFAVFKINSKLQ
ncbi:lipopolysaccharide biosynthesis protein [Flavobacterium sp. LC2016-12]|uniref:lipopolysaccharide biosynthesis protein n=1 Tax=Flavobacterium sp. LC2016-12 TaxID=2783794 RepID=UPI00188AB166|nr:oligosaccharide flippase family protein [Flavobacterium sp. LC2016-12]MBF4465681.1 lipopolysaccharide biosynthesis protein [Flavobacterium sp. LC2016-12]